jgi:two-component system, OmpR family, response regulator MtrA
VRSLDGAVPAEHRQIPAEAPRPTDAARLSSRLDILDAPGLRCARIRRWPPTIGGSSYDDREARLPVDARILVVEDDASIRELTERGLRNAGFEVLTAAAGDEGLARFRTEHPDAVVLDVMLPGMDGLEVCKAIRAASSVPVVMLTARSDTLDVVVGLESGADDYVTKPFEMPELIARVRASLRRATRSGSAEDVLRIGPVRVDVAAHTVARGEERIELTPTEFRLLTELGRHAGNVLSREQLLELVWGYGYLGDSRLVDATIQRLRAKIEPDPSDPQVIETVRGVGYRAART